MIYAELVELIQRYLENREVGFVADIPQIVRQAESRIYNQVRTVDQLRTVTDNVSTATITPPEDFVEPLYLKIGADPLRMKTLGFLRTAYGDSTGDPLFYALNYTTLYSGAQTITIAPVPTVSTAYELHYAGVPYSVVDQGATYLSTLFPECLLYYCLVEGYTYNKGEADMLKVYSDKAEQGLLSLRRSAEGLQLQDEYQETPVKD